MYHSVPKDHMEMLDFIAKVRRENLFRPTPGNDTFIELVMIRGLEQCTLPHQEM
jgi:hypothetical protein